MKRNDLDLSEGDVAICVFDILGNDLENLDEAFSLAESNGIMLALSNPCFELLYLLHFRDVDHAMNCQEVQELLGKFIVKYCKTEDYRNILMPKLKGAMKRASIIDKRHMITKSSRSVLENPSINVHIAIQAIQVLMTNNIGRQ